MAQTPEGKVKKAIDRELHRLGVWWFNPQMGAFGRAGVPDKIVCVNGYLVGIEAKADPTKKPTALQKQCMKKIEAAGGKCFVVCDDETLREAVAYMERLLGANN
jgi:ribosomal protein L18E